LLAVIEDWIHPRFGTAVAIPKSRKCGETLSTPNPVLPLRSRLRRLLMLPAKLRLSETLRFARQRLTPLRAAGGHPKPMCAESVFTCAKGLVILDIMAIPKRKRMDQSGATKRSVGSGSAPTKTRRERGAKLFYDLTKATDPLKRDKLAQELDNLLMQG
jgi:hypothetical protein